MQLSGRRIINENIVSDYCDEGIQQQGIDCRVIEIKKVNTVAFGHVKVHGKTELPAYQTFEEAKSYRLMPGYYEVTLQEGCKIPSGRAGRFQARSSLVRCGAVIFSGQYDAGFETDHMGCFMYVIVPIDLDLGARIAQFIVEETDEVAKKDMYNGQWQKDKQRQEPVLGPGKNFEPFGNVECPEFVCGSEAAEKIKEVVGEKKPARVKTNPIQIVKTRPQDAVKRGRPKKVKE